MKITNSQQIKKLLPKTYIKRSLHQELFNHLKKTEVTILYGARQVGKTSETYRCMLDLFKESPETDIFYYNLDYIKLVNSKDFQDPETFLNSITSQKKNNSEITYIFIDEAQRLKNVGLFIKYLYDKKQNMKFILTGSASLEIEQKVKEALTGRKKEFVLFPLSLSEFLTYKDVNTSNITKSFDLLEKSLTEFLVFGGYPEVATLQSIQDKREKLLELTDSYINRDVVDLFNIKDTNKTKLAISYLASGIGSIFSKDALCKSTGLSRAEVEKFIDIYEKTFVINRIKPFYRNRVKELTHQPKIYFTDVGFRNAVLNRLDEVMLLQEKGTLFENVISNEICGIYGSNKIKFWRNQNQTEVDFIVEESIDRIRAFEVKYDWAKETVPKNLASFIKSYSKEIVSSSVVSKNNFWELWKKAN